MYVTKKKLKNPGSYAIQIVESSRVGKKVRQSIVLYIGYAVGETELESLLKIGTEAKQRLEYGYSLESVKSEVKKSVSQVKGCVVNLNRCRELCRRILGLHDIFIPILSDLNLMNLFKSSSYNEILQHLVIARLFNPTSKRETSRLLKDNFDIDISLHSIYRLMDLMGDEVISTIKDNIYKNTLNLSGGEIKVLFYDATTLYFESFKEDELKVNGYSKDLKFNQPQVLLTVLVTSDGLPITYEVFPGNTYEGNTLQKAIEFICEKYRDKELFFVSDSGMLNQNNISYLETNDIKYIIGARLKNTPKHIKDKILTINKGDDEESFITIELTKSKNLIISYKSNRAEKNKKDREKAIVRLKEKLKTSKNPKDLLNNFGHKKFIEITGKTTITINQEKIQLEEKWDGLHGVITNVNTLQAKEIYSQYRGLWQIEEVFRVQKTDLKIRPIYHWTPKRIKSHLAISYITFSAIRTLQHKLKLSGIHLSCKEIKYNLSLYQITVIEDYINNKIYHMPGKVNNVIKSIYDAFKVKYDEKSYEVI